MSVYKRKYLRLPLIAGLVFGIKMFYVQCLLLGNGLYKSEQMAQLYFGGLPAEDSFNIIIVAMYMSIIILEVIFPNADKLESVFENYDIIACRCSQRGIITKRLLRSILVNDLLIEMVDCLLYCVVIERKITINTLCLVVSEGVLIYILSLIYLNFYCLIKEDIAYLGMLLAFFLPIIFTGFLYFKGTDIWKTACLYPLNICIYNYYHSMTYSCKEYSLSSVTDVSDLLGMNRIVIEIAVRIFLIVIFTVIAHIAVRRYKRI